MAADLVGKPIGRLTVIRRAGTTANVRHAATWECRCVCGRIVVRSTDHFRRRQKLSCGCDRPAPLEGQAEYSCWTSMRSRCRWKGHDSYKDYGGRGITVCERWLTFANFLADMGPRPSPRHSLDRFPDINGNYEPGNVRWATPGEQSSNRRNTVLVLVHGVVMRVHEAALALEITEKAVLARLSRGSLTKARLGGPLPVFDRDAARRSLLADCARVDERLTQLSAKRDRIMKQILDLDQSAPDGARRESGAVA